LVLVRIEFLDDEPASVTRVVHLYREVVAGRCDARDLWRELKAANQYGVTRGALSVLGGI
jgi:putative protease